VAGSPVTLTVTASAGVVDAVTGTATITATVTQQLTPGVDTPAEGAPVALTITAGTGNLSSALCDTNAQGTCNVQLTSGQYGTVTVQALVAATPPSSATVDVSFRAPWQITLSDATAHTVLVTSSAGNLGVSLDGGAATTR